MSAPDAATVAAVLAQHWQITVHRLPADRRGIAHNERRCTCGRVLPWLAFSAEHEHRAHVAAALLAAEPIAQALAAVEERDEWHGICARQNTRLAAEETRAEVAEAAVARVEALADEIERQSLVCNVGNTTTIAKHLRAALNPGGQP